MSDEKSRWQSEFDALPEWAQKMVRAVANAGGYGTRHDKNHFAGMTKEARQKYDDSYFFVAIARENFGEWFEGFCDMKELGEALTAPWPTPTDLPPREEMTTQNVVEMITAGEDEDAFDQPCYFGHRVDGHAVYCHNEAWPNAPRKCRRTWYTGGEVRDEDCPGFAPNPQRAAKGRT